MSDNASALAAAAARAAYAAAGHLTAGLFQVVPVSGREAPNIIPFPSRDRNSACAADADQSHHDD